MSRAPFYLTPELAGYVAAHSEPPGPVAAALIDETAELPNAGMQVAPEQAQFLAMLVRLTGAAEVLEIGTFTGLSSLAMASALPEGGRLVACDVSEEWTAVARRHWESAGVADRIELRIGKALDTLETLAAEGASFDLVFIDADKVGYPAYLERVLPMVPSGGLVVVDNTLRGGQVVGDGDDPDLAAIRRFNAQVVADPRVETLLLPVFDGLTLALKR